MKLLDQGGLSYLIVKIKDLLNLKADKTYVDDRVKTSVPVGAKFTDTVLKIVSSPTEPALEAGDIWHKEI